MGKRTTLEAGSVSRQCLSHYSKCWDSVKHKLTNKSGKLKKDQHCGWRFGQRTGDSVSRWGGHQCSAISSSQCDFLQRRTEVAIHDQAAEGEAKHEGLEEVGSREKSACSPLGGVLPPRAESSSSTAVWSSASHVAHVHAIPTAERSLADMCWGHCGASQTQEKCLSALDGRAAPLGGWDPVEDTGVRRIPPVRSGISLWHWRMYLGRFKQSRHLGTQDLLRTHSNNQLSDFLDAAEKDLKLTAIGRLHP